MGVTSPSTSESSLGVAAPLSLETHSSSSPSSDGLDIVNPTFCFDEEALLLRGVGARRTAAGLT